MLRALQVLYNYVVPYRIIMCRFSFSRRTLAKYIIPYHIYNIYIDRETCIVWNVLGNVVFCIIIIIIICFVLPFVHSWTNGALYRRIWLAKWQGNPRTERQRMALASHVRPTTDIFPSQYFFFVRVFRAFSGCVLRRGGLFQPNQKEEEKINKKSSRVDILGKYMELRYGYSHFALRWL